MKKLIAPNIYSFTSFFEECYEEYKQYCSSGSIKKEKTLKRIEIMENYLTEYFELDGSSDAEQDAPSSDDSDPLLDTDADGNNPAADETENSPASVAEGADSYAVPEQTDTIETNVEEKPPEEATQETE